MNRPSALGKLINQFNNSRSDKKHNFKGIISRIHLLGSSKGVISFRFLTTLSSLTSHPTYVVSSLFLFLILTFFEKKNGY